jgi:hypothetical protein
MAGRTAEASVGRISLVYPRARIARLDQYLFALGRIPELKQSKENPFRASDASFLVHMGVLGGESLDINAWPVLLPVQIQKTKVS